MNYEVINVKFDYDLNEFAEDVLSKLPMVSDDDLAIGGNCNYRGDEYRFFVVEEHCLCGGTSNFQEAKFDVWIEFDEVLENIIPSWAENDVSNGCDNYRQEVEEALIRNNDVRSAIKTMYYIVTEITEYLELIEYLEITEYLECSN